MTERGSECRKETVGWEGETGAGAEDTQAKGWTGRGLDGGVRGRERCGGRERGVGDDRAYRSSWVSRGARSPLPRSAPLAEGSPGLPGGSQGCGPLSSETGTHSISDSLTFRVPQDHQGCGHGQRQAGRTKCDRLSISEELPRRQRRGWGPQLTAASLPHPHAT